MDENPQTVTEAPNPVRAYFEELDGKVQREGAEMRRVAGACNVKPGYLYMVVAGHKKPSPELAALIEYATHERIDRRVLLPDFPWDNPAKREAA